jgi:hypothetical protein
MVQRFTWKKWYLIQLYPEPDFTTPFYTSSKVHFNIVFLSLLKIFQQKFYVPPIKRSSHTCMVKRWFKYTAQQCSTANYKYGQWTQSLQHSQELRWVKHYTMKLYGGVTPWSCMGEWMHVCLTLVLVVGEWAALFPRKEPQELIWTWRTLLTLLGLKLRTLSIRTSI